MARHSLRQPVPNVFGRVQAKMRCDALNLWQFSQSVGVEILVFRKVAYLDAQEILHISRDIVALEDLRSSIHRAFEGAGILVKLLREPDRDKDRDPWA